MDLEGILLITSYHSGYFSLSVQGSLKAESGQYVVDRKLFFRYSRPLGHAAGCMRLIRQGVKSRQMIMRLMLSIIF